MITVYQIDDSDLKTQGVMQSIRDVPETHIPRMSVFQTLEGEGMYIGTPRVLARVSGCAVGCSWCDSKHTWNAKGARRSAQMITVEQFCDEIVEEAGHVREVSITGGEPMHYIHQMHKIIGILSAKGYKVSIETSGLIIVPEVFRKAYAVSLDVKTPSSGVLLTHENIKALNSCAYLYDEVQLKAVVRDEVDLAFLLENFHSILHPTSSKVKPLVLTPCADNTKGSVSAQSILDVVNMCVAWNNKYNIRIIPQIHKWLEVDTEMR